MSWQHREVHGISEHTIGPDRNVPIMHGRVGERECGCAWFMGIRLGDGEPCFGLQPCFGHGPAAERTIRSLQSMPPSERALGELAEGIFENAIQQPV